MGQARDEAGNIWEVDATGNARLVQAAGHSAGAITIGSPDPYRAKQDARADNADNRAQRAADLAAQNAARNAANDSARLDIERRRLELTEAGQSGAKLTAAARSDAIAGYKSGQAVERLVGDLEKLYAAGPGATSGLSGLQDYLPLTANQRFDQAGNAARGNVGSALGFTGGQLNTATEAAQSVGPYLPQAGDRDEVILDKIARLRQLAIDAKSRSTQILGGIPDANGRVSPVEEADSPPLPQTVMASAAPVQAAQRTEGGSFSDAAGVAMAEKLAAAYKAGADVDKLNSMLSENGYGTFSDPDIINMINKRRNLRFAPPQVSDNRGAVSKAVEGMTGGAVGAYGLNAIDAVTGGYSDELFGGRTQLAKDYASDQFPVASTLGNVSGAVASMIPLSRAAGALSAGSRFLTPARAALGADLAYGGFYGSGQNNENRLAGAGEGVIGALLGNGIGAGLNRAVGGAVRGVADPAVRYLSARGVPLTFGQALGNQGFVGRTVNKLESLPVIGDFLNERRRQGIEAFNRADLEDVVAPINGTAPRSGGMEGIADAQRQVSNAYGQALNGVNVQADPQFVSELGAAISRGRAVPQQGDAFGHIVDTELSPLFPPNGQMDGDMIQAALQSVRSAGSDLSGENAMGARAASAFSDMDTAIIDLLRRNAPQAAEGLNNANAAYAALASRNKAAQTAVNSGIGPGYYTPAQLQRSITQNTRAYGGDAAAARGQNLSDLTRYGQEVLPSTVPDSGTPGRIAAMLLPATLGGSAYGVGTYGDSDASSNAAATLAVLAALTSRTGANVAQNALVRRPQWAQAAGQRILDNPDIAKLLATPLVIGAVTQ